MPKKLLSVFAGIFAVAAVALLVGCKPVSEWKWPGQPAPVPTAPAPVPERTAPEPLVLRPEPIAPAPTAAPDTGPVMAYVDNRPLYMSELHAVLVETHGLRFAQQMIINEIVRQEAVAKTITVTDQDIADEHDRTVRETFPSVTDDTARQRLFEDLLAQRNLTRKQWDMGMRRNAMIRKMVPTDVPVSDEELQRAFGNIYGRQVVVRHIETTSLAKAQNILSRLTAGADFTELATKESTNESRANGGLLPQFGKDTQAIWPAFRQAALSLRTVGEMSNPVQTGTAFHLIRLEKNIQPATVRFEDVKGKLIAQIKRVKIRAMQQQILKDLIRRARAENTITYVDPTLKAQVQKGAAP